MKLLCALGVVIALAGVPGMVRAEDQPGSLGGTVRLSGAPPRNLPISIAADPYCVPAGGRKARKVLQKEVVVGNGGGLANVFVRLTGPGLAEAAGPVPEEPVVIEQRGCIYYPRMTGSRVGQTLRVINGDSTIHNVRSISQAGSDFNIAQAMLGMMFDFELVAEEPVLRLRCDIHPWMRSFIGVVSHPWFAVTGEDGRFEIEGVPPGHYEIALWHERFGALGGEVAVEAGGVATLDFEYNGGVTSRHLDVLLLSRLSYLHNI